MNKTSELKGRRVFIAEYYGGCKDSYLSLEDMGAEIIWGRLGNDAKVYSEGELIEICKDVDAIIKVSRDTVTEAVLKACPRLRVIIKCGIGVDKEPLGSAMNYAVIVANTAPTVVTPVAEHAMALILASIRKLPNVAARGKEGLFRSGPNRFRLLQNKVVGLFAFGNIARAVAKRLSGFECEVIANDPFLESEVFKTRGVRQVDFDELLEASDIISLHAPLTELTRGVIGAPEIAKMKDGVFIVNTARGELIQTDALVEALKNEKVAYAGLDVVAGEPLPKEHPLLSLPNALVTPHVAGGSVESLELTVKIAVESVRDAMLGKLPKHVVNADCNDAWLKKWGVN